MIGTNELQTAFDAIGTRVRLTPTGMDFRVHKGQPGIEVRAAYDADDQPYFDLRVNYLRVVDLNVVELDAHERYLVLAADDWGDELDAPPRVFRCGVSGRGLYVDAVTEFTAED